MPSKRQKGQAFERETCEAMSKWLTRGKRTDLFWRSAMSGGRSTVKFKKGKQNVTQGGDLSALDPIGHAFLENFVIECKFYNDLDSASSLLRGYGRLLKFWRETNTDAKRCKKWPLLIAKQNRFPTLLVTNRAGADFLGLSVMAGLQFRLTKIGDNKFVVLFDEFLSEIRPPTSK